LEVRHVPAGLGPSLAPSSFQLIEHLPLMIGLQQSILAHFISVMHH